MSAALQVQPIAARPIERPRYTSTAFALSHFDRFYTANEPALTQYWNELRAIDDEQVEESADDLQAFAFVQYDLARAPTRYSDCDLCDREPGVRVITVCGTETVVCAHCGGDE